MDLRNRKNKVKWFTKGRKKAVDTHVLHYISCCNIEGFENDPYNVDRILQMFYEGVKWSGRFHHFSAHRLIVRNGTIYQLVDLRNVAWHAGKSRMPSPDDRINVNGFSIGTELVGMAGDEFTDEQYSELSKIVVSDEKEVIDRKLGKIKNYVGHDTISGRTAVKLGIRSDVKKDPGSLFDWERFTKDRILLKYEKKENRKTIKKCPAIIDSIGEESVDIVKSAVAKGFWSSLFSKFKRRKIDGSFVIRRR